MPSNSPVKHFDGLVPRVAHPVSQPRRMQAQPAQHSAAMKRMALAKALRK